MADEHHGHEPKRIEVAKLADYLETMSKAVFQTGISWRVVESKWPGIKEAFRGFDPVTVSKLTGAELDELVQDTRVIRNHRKIAAIVENAWTMLALDKQHGGFQNYLRSSASFEELVKDLRRRFKFLGDMGAYYFLWVVGEKVPSWEEWSSRETQPRRRPVRSH